MRATGPPHPKPCRRARRRPGRQRATRLASGASLALLVAAGGPSAAAPQSPLMSVTDVACVSQTLVLPGLTPTSASSVTAMSDSGFVVGTSRDEDTPSTAVVWTSPEHVLDTGVGGFVLDNGNYVDAAAVDVNEAGLVAINRRKFNVQGRVMNDKAVLWSQSSGAIVLPAPAFRPRASLTAMNDDGDVVGSIWGKGHGSVPVVWRDGQRFRLPRSPQTVLFAADINNQGVVVGTADHGRGSTSWDSWWWRRGGRIRPLAPPDDTMKAYATQVDDSGRIIGRQRVGPGDSVRTVLWRTRDASPRRVMRLDTLDLHNSGYMAAIEPGFRGFGASAYVGHLRDGVNARLPNPTDAGEPIEWNNVRAVAVATGSSAFAPQGGVTIGGHAQDYEWMTEAVLWTCAQTLLGVD